MAPIQSIFRKPAFWCFFLLVISAVPYIQVIHHEFVTFDDHIYITENMQVQKGLTFENIRWAFTDFSSANWHPVTWLSHMLDCELFGLNPGMHHLVNVFFHVITTILCFLALYQLTNDLWRSLIVSTFFAIHPLHVESVCWASERKDVLSALFWMLTLLLYSLYLKRERNVILYLLLIFAYALGLMAKPMLVTLPFVLLLLDIWPLGRIPSLKEVGGSFKMIALEFIPLVKEKFPLFILMFLSCIITIKAQSSVGAIDTLENISFSDRLLNSVYAYASYLYKTVWPLNLACFYPYDKNLAVWKFFLSILIVALISFLALWNIRKRPYLLTGWFWYLGTLVPVIGLVKVGSQAMADRYTYIPHIGLFISVVWSLGTYHKKWLRYFWGAACVTAMFLFSYLTWVQAGYWKDSFSLWNRAAKVTRNNYFAHSNLGLCYADKDQPEFARTHFEKALLLKPNDYDTLNNYAGFLSKNGEEEKAQRLIERAVSLKPNSKHAYNNLGVLSLRQNEFEKSLEHFDNALKMDPGFPEANNNKGKALFQLERYDAAMKHFVTAIENKPDCLECLMNLGALYRRQKKYALSVEAYEKAAALNMNSPDIRYLLGKVCLEKGDRQNALSAFKAAIDLDDSNKDYYNELGRCHLDLKNYKKAVFHFSKALGLDSDFILALNNLGLAYAAQNKFDLASIQFKTVLSKNPEHRDANYNLANTLFAQNRISESIIYYKTAIHIDPAFPESRYNLANSYAQLNQLKEAIFEYKAAIRNAPHYAAAYNNLGIVYIRLNDFNEALVHFEKASRIDPSYKEAADNLKRTRDVIKQYQKIDEEISALQKILVQKPADADVLNNIGYLYASKHDYPTGIEYCKRALGAAPDNPVILENSAAIYQISGDLENAVKILRKLNKIAPDKMSVYYSLARNFVLQNNIGESLNWLHQLFNKGFSDIDALQQDPAFAQLRLHPDYRKLVREKFPEYFKRE